MDEEAKRTARTSEDVQQSRTTSLVWQSGRESKVDVARSAFVYTSFINGSLTCVCFAGLMINFISAFVWSLMKKWMAKGEAGVWEPLTTKEIADVVLCYGVLKGTMQWIFGFAGDRYGRKPLVVGGLLTCVLGLVMLGGLGVNNTNPKAGFFVAALLIGFGTAMMYSNLLAAICDHADPSWRASALGAYRFWRDMGYAIGALVTGAVADWIGIPWSIFVTAMLTLLAGILIFFFYEEVAGDTSSEAEAEAVLGAVTQPKFMAPVQMMGAPPPMAFGPPQGAFPPYGQPPYGMPPMMPGYGGPYAPMMGQA